MNALTGKTVCVTGAIRGYSRSTVMAAIREHGAKATKSVSSKTDILVIGTSSYGTGYRSEKMKQASRYGTAIWSESELLKVLRA